ncbi:MAG: sensor histidine kinase [Bryobacteraceae bacterium]|nr:sensor histidine kinase [Bryobacteraceae bacterium]
MGELAVLPVRSRRLLCAARLGVSVAAFALAFSPAAPAAAVAARVTLLAFGGYALATLMSAAARRFSESTGGWVLDGFFLLLCAGLPAPAAGWLCAAVFAFFVSTGLLFQTWPRLAVGAGAGLALVLLIRSGDASALGPGLAACSAVGLVAGWYKRRLAQRVFSAARRVQSGFCVQEAVRAERQRLAADFHDGPLQNFAGLQMRLEVVRKLLERDPSEGLRDLAELQRLTGAQTCEIRAFIRDLAASEDGGAGPATVGFAVERFRRESGLPADLEGEDAVSALDCVRAREVVKIVREGLHNIHKHAGASHAAVRIGRPDGGLEIAIADDGKGFPFDGAYALDELDRMGMGPQSIKRRVRALGGDLVVQSRPNAGAELRIRIPL